MKVMTRKNLMMMMIAVMARLMTSAHIYFKYFLAKKLR